MEREDEFYTTEELMKKLQVSRWAIYRATKSGRLKVAKKVGRVNYYSKKDIFGDYLQENFITKNS